MFGCNLYGVSNLILSLVPLNKERKLFDRWLYMEPCAWRKAGSSFIWYYLCSASATGRTYKIKGQKYLFQPAIMISDPISFIWFWPKSRITQRSKGISLLSFQNIKWIQKFPMMWPLFLFIIRLGQKATPAMHLSFGDRDDCTGTYWVKKIKDWFRCSRWWMVSDCLLDCLEYRSPNPVTTMLCNMHFERKQGRKINFDNESDDPVLIGEHPDIEGCCILKSCHSGGLALLFQCFITWIYK